LLCFVGLQTLDTGSVFAGVITFEELPLGPTGFYNGDSGIGTNSNGWNSGGVFFNNTFDASFGGFWIGWSYSNVVNSTTPGFTNQYAAWPGGGSDSRTVAPGQKYAIGFENAFFNLPTGSSLQSVDLTNTTYAALSMRDGDAFAKKFGGTSGNDPDFLRVTLTGYDDLGAMGNAIGAVTVSLSDFTAPNQADDFILSSWLNVDLTSISAARSVALSFASSDQGPFGSNTPSYVALDNLAFDIAAVPEPSTWLCLIVGLPGIAYATRKMRRKHPPTMCCNRQS
jgi:hypothetical protein